MSRRARVRIEDPTFDLNLAPMLDIIVSIIPMLLLSLAFMEITMVETPVPQAVQKAIETQEKNNEVTISLHASKKTGFKITINEKGRMTETAVALKGGDLDLDALHLQIVDVKQRFPAVFRLELNPSEELELKEIITIMDRIRQRGLTEPKITFTDVETGKPVETNLLFPDVVFGNVAGG